VYLLDNALSSPFVPQSYNPCERKTPSFWDPFHEEWRRSVKLDIRFIGSPVPKNQESVSTPKNAANTGYDDSHAADLGYPITTVLVLHLFEPIV